jgi:hypothetical protein
VTADSTSPPPFDRSALFLPLLSILQLFVCHSESISLNLDTRTEGAIPSAEQPRLAVITLDPSSSSSSSGSGAASGGDAASSSSRTGVLRLMTETAGDFPTINPR